MTTDKQVNLGQLQAEAVALKGGHRFFSMSGVAASSDISPAGNTLYCQASDGTLTEVCATGQTAYAAHAAVATPAPDPLKPYRDALATAAAADSGLNDDTKTALTNLLAAMAPSA